MFAEPTGRFSQADPHTITDYRQPKEPVEEGYPMKTVDPLEGILEAIRKNQEIVVNCQKLRRACCSHIHNAERDLVSTNQSMMVIPSTREAPLVFFNRIKAILKLLMCKIFLY